MTIALAAFREVAPPWECAGTVAAAAGGVEAAVTVAAAAAVAVAVVEVVAVAVAGAEDSQQHEDVTYLSNLLPHPSPAIIKPDIVLRFNPSQTEMKHRQFRQQKRPPC